MDKKAVVRIQMEYYSAIKKNTFESALMRWMKLEPIIQSEVSQKEKYQYSVKWSEVKSLRHVRLFATPMNLGNSAIKKNRFESVLMRWMKLEPIIQSEVSQKEKYQYSILTHIYGI